MFRLLSIKLSLGILAFVFYTPTLLISLALPKNKRAYWWRLVSTQLIEFSLFVGRVHVHTVGKKYTDGPQIYASNHPSVMDGFVMQAVLGPSAVPVIAPLQQFPFIIAVWLRNMGAIDVLRDDIDKARYAHGHTKREMLEKAIAVLARGESIIIFPEGHTEMLEALYYFHTGTARIALASGIPIQPVVIKDAHTVFTNSRTSRNGILTISFEQRLLPECSYGNDILFTANAALRERVRDLTARLEREILRSLPLRLRYEQRNSESDIGVFVDIDMTLYEGLSQIDFVWYLIRTGELSLWQGMKVGGLFVGEQLGLLSHEQMMRRAMRVLSGWNKNTVERLVRRFFFHIAVPKIQYSLYSVLQDHLAKRHRLVFVSEAIHPLTHLFADFFEADGAIDTSLRRRGRRYTGEIGFLCRGENKAQGVRSFAEEHHISLEKSFAYADSFSDVPMLSLVGHPVVVHPDRKLKKHASLHGMRVLKHVS